MAMFLKTQLSLNIRWHRQKCNTPSHPNSRKKESFASERKHMSLFIYIPNLLKFSQFAMQSMSLCLTTIQKDMTVAMKSTHIQQQAV